jgi:protein TonB
MVTAVALVATGARDQLERGGEIAIPVEFVLVGPAEQMAEAEGAAPPEQQRPTEAQPSIAPQPVSPQPVSPPLAVYEASPPAPPVADVAAQPAPAAAESVPSAEASPVTTPAPVASPAPSPDPAPAPLITAPQPAAAAAPRLAAAPRRERPERTSPPRTRPEARAGQGVAGQGAVGQGAVGHGISASDRASSARASTAGVATTAGQAEIASHRARVLAHLQRFKVYPREAQEREVEGRVTVAFTLAPNGEVTAVTLAGSSGSAVLDQATLAMVRRAAPFPAAPSGTGPSRFSAMIRYDLR